MTTLHASVIAIDEQAILLRGPSGSGKSDLALRLIEQGAQLVADDQVTLVKKGADLIAFAPDPIAGLLEIRTIGIIKLAHLKAAPVRMIIDLDPAHDPERMPQDPQTTLENVTLPCYHFKAFEASTPAKVSLALAVSLGHIPLVEEIE